MWLRVLIRNKMIYTMLSVMYDIPSRPDVSKILIKEETIINRDEPEVFLEKERKKRA